MEVTVLMFSSRGANAILAIRSHIIQKTAPPRKVPGMMISGLDVPKLLFIRNGTAIPTKEFDVYAHALCISFSQLISSNGL